ncbi:MATE family efflux transporter [Acidaminobacter sp. JC074]|uniref:MATE family efflux transporter n=1 Tax=Acidaminobacter sp. JC074 TaxID=2530199 RepID=UPI001F10C694|nr:MATE family efflux transporter [Acidaminobacter sp. JC074]MCH4889836.1 MATE family efflux transporter [Acidaminobacter sp. JC074]
MNNIQLGNDNIKKIFWMYAIPSVLSMIAQTTATMIDSIFIGRYVGSSGLSAITIFFPLIGIVIGIASMFSIGGTTLAGIELGKKNLEKSNNYFNVTLAISLILSITFTVLIQLTLPYLLKLQNIDLKTTQQIMDYGGTISWFFLFFMMNFALTFFLKLDGKPILVVATMISGTVINILLDYLFIAKMGLELRGAALATGMSQLIPFIVLIVYTFSKSNWKIKKPVFHFHEIKQIAFNGSSELLSQSAVSIAGLIINAMIITRVGVIGLAGYAVSQQIASIAGSLGYGFAESNQAALSYNYGANLRDRVDALRNYTLKANIITGIILFLLANIFSYEVSSLFVKEPETIEMSVRILKYFSYAFIFMGANITIGTYYTAINDPILSGGITLFRSFIALLVGLAILPAIFGNNGIWMSIVFREIVTIIAGTVLLFMKPYGLIRGRQIKNAA